VETERQGEKESRGEEEREQSRRGRGEDVYTREPT
jgi:hypothetical protein